MKKMILFVTGLISFCVIAGIVIYSLVGSELTIYCPASEEALFQELIASYNAQDSKTKVILKIYEPNAAALNQVIRDGADMISIPKEAVTSELILENSFFDLSQVIPAEQTVLSLSEELYFFPINGDIPLLLCNEKLLKSKNLFIPESIGDFQGLCLALELTDIDPFVFSTSSEASSGVKLFSEGILLNSANSAGHLWDEAGELNMGFQDLEWISYLFDEDAELFLNGYGSREDLLKAFPDSNVAMMPISSGELAALGELPESIKTTHIFGTSPSRILPWISDIRVAVPQSTDNRTGAIRFMNFLLLREAQQIIHQQRGKLPVVKEVSVSGELEEAYLFVSYSDGARVSFFEELPSKQRRICEEEIMKIFDSSIESTETMSKIKDRLLKES